MGERPDVAMFCLRIGMCLLTALLLWAVTKGWEPPFVYRIGDVLSQDIALVIPADEGAAFAAERTGACRRTAHGRSGWAVRGGTTITKRATCRQRRAWCDRSPRSALSSALYALCGYFVYHQDRRLLIELRRFATLLLLVIVTTAMACWAWPYPWRAEIVPVLIFGMTCGIAYKRELALLLTVSLLIFLGLVRGYGLDEFVVLVGATSAAILLLGRIRSRSKLIKVGFVTGLVTVALSLITGLLDGQSLGQPCWTGACAMACGHSSQDFL